ncbi:MAG: hypothetical protein DRO18_07605, partial [Thermoprotei archaeon]
MKKTVFFIVMFFLFPYACLAVPYFHDPIPQPNTYIYGKDDDVFQISVTDDDLNASTVKLHIRVEDPTSTWSSVEMNCIQQTTSEWVCNTTVPGLYALVENGNWLLYYFDGYDVYGEYGNYGNSTDPLRVRVDRTGPEIEFLKPQPNTFCSGKINITLNVTDELSEVNSGSVEYSFDNSTWKSTSYDYINNYYVSDEVWDTTQLSDGQNVTIYARASDVLGNWKYVSINVTVENEAPKLAIESPLEGELLTGSVEIKVTANDSISGIAFVSYQISGVYGNLSCTPSNDTFHLLCTYWLDTTTVPDGMQELIITAQDLAGNIASSSVKVSIDNVAPEIIITSPSSGEAVQGLVNVTATVKDAGSGIANVTFRWETETTSGEWKIMSCQGTFYEYECTYSWDSTTVSDGTYSLRVQAVDNLGKSNSVTVKVGVSNLSPIANTTQTTTAQTTTTISESKTSESQQNQTTPAASFISNIAENEVVEFISKNALPIAAFSLSSLVRAGVGIHLRKKRATEMLKAQVKEEEEEIPEVEINVEDYKLYLDSVKKAIKDALYADKIEDLEAAAKLGVIYSKRMENHPPLVLSAIETIRNAVKDKELLKRFEESVKSKEKEIDYV